MSKESCLQAVGRSHLWSLCLRIQNLFRNYCPVSRLSEVSKVFEKLKNIRLVNQLREYGLLSDFQYGIRSSQSTTDLLTVIADRITRVFNRSGAAWAVAHDISKLLTGFDMLVFFTNLCHEFLVRYLAIFCLLSVIDSFEWFCNPDHNILELYNMLVEIWFTTSKTKLDIQYSKLDNELPQKLPNDLKLTILGN